MKDIILSPITLDELRATISEAVKVEVEKINLNNKSTQSEYITRKQTAIVLGISLPTLNDWSKRGLIPSYRIASRVRYKKAEVEDSLHKVTSLKYRKS